MNNTNTAAARLAALQEQMNNALQGTINPDALDAVAAAGRLIRNGIGFRVNSTLAAAARDARKSLKDSTEALAKVTALQANALKADAAAAARQAEYLALKAEADKLKAEADKK